LRADVPLRELCRAIVDCPHSTPVWTETGPLVLRSQNIRNGRLDLSEPSHTDEYDFAERTRRAEPVAGDLVITREAPMGEVCMIPANLRCCLGQRMVLLRPDRERVEPAYLLYALQSRTVQHEIRVNEGTGSTVSNLRIPLLEALPIPVPDLCRQRAIAHILGTLDDKIELNRRMSETLEAMARALFKSWFVDFEHAATDSQFPETELGPIPSKWSIGRLAEVCRAIFSGGTPSTSEPGYWGGGVPWLSSGETRSTLIIDTEKSITLEGVQNSSTRLAPAGATVIASAGQGHTRGQTSLLTFDSYVNQSVVVLQADETRSSDLYLFFDLERRYEQFRQLSDGHSSRGSLTTRLLADLRVVVPPKDLVAAFDRVAGPLVARMTECLHESRTLAALRDTLLPKLISGELRVRDAERFAGHAL
jgi:type I restriction enzyme, S subunit